MTIQEYLSSLRGKTAAVLGIGVSNTPLIELLCRNGVQVIACDKKSREDLGERAKQLEALGAHLQLGEGYLDDLRADVVFRTPGLRPDVPALLEAKARGSIVTSEMEIFFEVCPCTIIGVTGSDGKTTTTSIIAEMLRAAGKTVYLGGNIGHPLLCDAEKMQPEDFAVVELSSFQLLVHRGEGEYLSPSARGRHRYFQRRQRHHALSFEKGIRADAALQPPRGSHGRRVPARRYHRPAP